jgi:hypothetical protein
MSDTITLEGLANRFLSDRPLPDHIGSMPLQAWLESIGRDQTEFSRGDLALRLGATSSPPWVGEVALALKFRIEESVPDGAD